MRAFKKIMSAVIAAATLMTGMSFPVSADYDPCDIDRNGYIGMNDLAILNRYLMGSYYVTNYNLLDVNGSLTVDAADNECLTAALLGSTYSGGYFSRESGTVVASPTVSGFTPNSAASSTMSREYMRYVYDDGSGTGRELDTYTLTPSIYTLNSGTNSRSVIGEDDRYPATGSENSGIVMVGNGTGFVVDDHVIATAAHCVYNVKNSCWVSDLTIETYDNNGNIVPNSNLTAVEAHVPSKYKINYEDNKQTHKEYDYALITVAEDLSDRVHFSLGTSYNVNNSTYSNIPVYVTGCPGEVNGASNNSNKLYSAEGNIIGCNANSNKYPFDYKDSRVKYNVDTSGGDSGAPLYTITKTIIDNKVSYIYTALAIHTTGVGTYNCGPVITSHHIQFYINNSNINY